MLLPPPGVPTEPQTVLDALQQRLNKYREASVQARGSGDERKARMHERIAKVGLHPRTCPGSASHLASCSVHTQLAWLFGSVVPELFLRLPSCTQSCMVCSEGTFTWLPT